MTPRIRVVLTMTIVACAATALIASAIASVHWQGMVTIDRAWGGPIEPSIVVDETPLVAALDVPADGVSRIELKILRESGVRPKAIRLTLRGGSEVIRSEAIYVAAGPDPSTVSLGFRTIKPVDFSKLELEIRADAEHADIRLFEMKCDCPASLTVGTGERRVAVVSATFVDVNNSLQRGSIALRRLSELNPTGLGGHAVVVALIATFILFLSTLAFVVRTMLAHSAHEGDEATSPRTDTPNKL